jgi:hypothetical protein
MPIWDALQDLFMDTEIDYSYIARRCANSKYSIPEIREILFFEVFPALRFNICTYGAEWRGFEINWLKKRILEKNTRNKYFQPLIFRGYTKECWSELVPLIQEIRQS